MNVLISFLYAPKHLSTHVIYFCKYSDFVKSFSSNVMELPLLPEFEVSHENPFHLHQCVSQGDVRSVSLVGAPKSNNLA